jgi:hypothetical protein
MLKSKIYSSRGGNLSEEHPDKRSTVLSCDNSSLLVTSHRKSRWHKLKALLFPCLKNNKRLAEKYAEAKVEWEKSEAHRIAEQAAEISARKDLLKQEEVKEFSKIIDEIFKADGLPPAAKMLKLTKLMENNPQIMTQINKVEELFEKLHLEKFMDIEFKNEYRKPLLTTNVGKSENKANLPR